MNHNEPAYIKYVFPNFSFRPYACHLSFVSFVSQCNGLDERFNQTLQTMIAKFVSDKKETWSDFLDMSVFAYNTSRHTSSQFTPFELMFNWRAAIPINIELRKEMSEDLATGYIELPEPDPAVVEEKRKKKTRRGKREHFASTEKTEGTI